MATSKSAAIDPESLESAYDRLERRWTEQLSELRVAQAGTQIMMGFLLTLVFQPSFAETSSLEQSLYLGLVITATAATALAIAPVSFHRILFGHPGAKARIVAVTQVFLQLTIVLVGLVLSGTVALIFNIVVGGTGGLIAGVVAATIIIVIWLIVPMVIRRTLRR